MVSKRSLLIAGILLLNVVLGAVQYAMPVHTADAETSLTADVTVNPQFAESYGASVVGSSRCILTRAALREPDGRGVVMFRGGWISVELEDTITGCSDVSIWAAKRGWGAPRFNVYVSSNGSTWTKVGSGRCVPTGYSRYDFGGDFGDVRYIGVSRSGGWFVTMLLDAVWAKSQ